MFKWTRANSAVQTKAWVKRDQMQRVSRTRNQFLNLPIVFLDTEQRVVSHLWHERHPRGEPTSQVWICRQSWYNNPSEQTDNECLLPLWARALKRAPTLIKMWSHFSPAKARLGLPHPHLSSSSVLTFPLEGHWGEKGHGRATVGWRQGLAWEWTPPWAGRFCENTDSQHHPSFHSSIRPSTNSFIHIFIYPSIYSFTPKCLLRASLHSGLCGNTVGLLKIQGI